MTTTTTTRQAVLYLRSIESSGISDVQRRIMNRLEELAADGLLASADYEVWGQGIPATGGPKSHVHAIYDEMSEWADENDRSLTPAFEVRKTQPMGTDEQREVISFPMLCLAIYEGDEVEAVFPHADGDRVYTIDDGLAALEALNDERQPDGPVSDAPGQPLPA